MLTRFKETTQTLNALPAILRFALITLCSLALYPAAQAKTLLFRQSVDTEIPMGLLGHLMDLSGPYSIALNASANTTFASKSASAVAVVPFTTKTDTLLHGYFISPTYIRSEGQDRGTLTTLGQHGWQLMLGRGNLDFPGSVFRGYLMMGYRDLRLTHDASTENVQNGYLLSSQAEKKRSVILSTGVSSTQNSLISQKRPFLDSELLVDLRYDYEKGDIYTHAKTALFYPTWVDLGASLGWYKVFRETKSAFYDEVSDDFIIGPRLRGRAWNHLAFDTSVEWHAYRDFNGKLTFPGPRWVASLIANF